MNWFSEVIHVLILTTVLSLVSILEIQYRNIHVFSYIDIILRNFIFSIAIRTIIIVLKLLVIVSRKYF